MLLRLLSAGKSENEPSADPLVLYRTLNQLREQPPSDLDAYELDGANEGRLSPRLSISKLALS